MRNLFALIGLVVVLAGGLGWYLGWYKVNVSKTVQGTLQIQTEVDTKKVEGDSSAFFQKVGQIVNDKVQQAGGTGASAPADTPAAAAPAAPALPPNAPLAPKNTAPFSLPGLPSPPNRNQ